MYVINIMMVSLYIEIIFELSNQKFCLFTIKMTTDSDCKIY